MSPLKSLKKRSIASTCHKRRSSSSSSTLRISAPSTMLDADIQGPYIKCRTQRDRVDRILTYMQKRHRWSIKDLLRAYVTQPSNAPYKQAHTSRASFLLEAIYGQEDVLEALQRTPNPVKEVDIEPLVRRLRRELSNLEERENRPSTLGQFDAEATIEELHLDQIAIQCQEAVPELWELLIRLVAPKRDCSKRDTTAAHNRLVLITSILAYTRSPRLYNQLPMLLGIYLHSMGAKRRVLEVLHSLGVTIGYSTLQIRVDAVADVGKVRIKYLFG